MIDNVEETPRVDERGSFYSNGWEPPVSGLTVEIAGQLVSALDEQIDHHETQATMGSWWLADVLVWCEDHLGDAFSQVTPDPSKSRKSYLMLMRIARAFPERERRYPPEVMKIWTHNEVYNLEPYVQDALLEDYVSGELSYGQLREEAQKLRNEQAEGSRDEPVVEHESSTCPLCAGVGEVEHEMREEFLRFMATRSAATADAL